MPKDSVWHCFVAKLRTYGNVSMPRNLRISPRRIDVARNSLARTLGLSQTICVSIFRQNGWYETYRYYRKIVNLKIVLGTCTDSLQTHCYFVRTMCTIDLMPMACEWVSIHNTYYPECGFPVSHMLSSAVSGDRSDVVAMISEITTTTNCIVRTDN